MSTDSSHDLNITSAIIRGSRLSGWAMCLVLGISVFALGSCSVIKREGQRETYDISAPREFDNLPKGRRTQILIKEPTALKAVDSDRIIVKPSKNVVTYLSRAQWTDTVP